MKSDQPPPVVRARVLRTAADWAEDPITPRSPSDGKRGSSLEQLAVLVMTLFFMRDCYSCSSRPSVTPAPAVAAPGTSTTSTRSLADGGHETTTTTVTHDAQGNRVTTTTVTTYRGR